MCPNCCLEFEAGDAWRRLFDNAGYCPQCGERMPAVAFYCELRDRVSHPERVVKCFQLVPTDHEVTA